MKQELLVSSLQDTEFSRYHAAGARLARSLPVASSRASHVSRTKIRYVERLLARAATVPPQSRSWLHENVRLVRTAEKQVKDFSTGLRHFPVVKDETGTE